MIYFDNIKIDDKMMLLDMINQLNSNDKVVRIWIELNDKNEWS